MDGVNGSGATRRHFSPEEEEALRKDPSTSAVLDQVRKDAHVGGPSVEVRGDDKTWRAVKEEHQNHVGAIGAAHVGHAAFEGIHLAEIHAVEHAVGKGGAALVPLGAAAGFALGVYEWHEAYLKGQEQSVALAKDELHVAMLTQLDLPHGYKAEQLAERAQAGKSAQSVAQKMATPFATIDKPLIATMQLHADRGMHAGRDFVASGLTKEAFLSANPKLADAYAKDPAFHDGFDAIVWVKHKGGPGAYEAATANLTERDGWYAQSNVSYRM